MNRETGFSLIELLIVVAIILVISAIAIPNFLKSRMAANEASAVSTLRTMNAALIAYSTTYPECGFPRRIRWLRYPDNPGDPPDNKHAGLLDNTLAQDIAEKSGYRFDYDRLGRGGSCNPGSKPGPDYDIEAEPLVVNKTGIRFFYTDSSAVIRYNIAAQADENSPPIE